MQVKNVIIKTETKGYLRGCASFGDLVESPVFLSGKGMAKSFQDFMQSYMMISGKVQRPVDSLIYFEDSVCSSVDQDLLMNLFNVYLESRCWLLIEPYIEMGSLVRSSHSDFNFDLDVSVDSLKLRMVSRERCFLYIDGAKPEVYAVFGMLMDDAKNLLSSSA